MYSVTITGNVEECRTEAEIIDGEGAVSAVVYEALDGWHTNILAERLDRASAEFQTAVENAKESLSHYVNRVEKTYPRMQLGGHLRFGS